MNTLGNLGGYITKGVCSVSGSFQPFGGAVDIIVVEQPDGSFKSSPWYVRFGKFQGVLKSKENIVKIGVNGTEAKFHMYLNSKGQAFFLKEKENDDVKRSDKGDLWQDECSSSSGNTLFKSRGDNFVGSATTPCSPDGGTPIPRTNSDQSEIIGSNRLSSFEYAEIAAQLLDVNWSTCLPTGSPRKDGRLPDAADSVTGEKLELISKMGEDCNCHSESQKSSKPAAPRHSRLSRSEARVYCSDIRGVAVRSDAVEGESIGKYQDHEESDRDDTVISASRPVLKEINSDGNGNVDVKGPGHRLSNSLDTKPNSSKPPAIFSRSYGGREGYIFRRHTDQEGSDSVHSTKSAPADAPLEHDSELKRTITDRSMRVFSPTSEQLASLDLDAGGNVITFTFWTKMLGKQQVDARIYLWKWSDRIIISDVDGTITKSDVLGQCMPLVGMDWTQEGVARLYSSIKDNGYRLMFLSARSISQSYITRQFLLNIKQDGIALPDGPVVISPDGLFPSLYREVIRRVPHEFKIACLEDIKVLFPPDRNPFYAGFGNRDTDEISYLKVGIPKGKIFIINPKGEVVVNRHIQRSSYTYMNTLVDYMLPSSSSSEQEEFNSWNYWKLPPPHIEV